MSLQIEHLSFQTQDELNLPALFFQPEQTTNKAVIFLHGCGSSSVFYKVSKLKLFSEELAKIGWSFLAFNNRGAHYLKKFSFGEGEEKIDKMYGTATEVIAETVHDIDAAIEFLQSRGYTEIVLLGESTGANKICVYHHYRPDNQILGYALVGGGDDTGLWWQMLEQEAEPLFNQAAERVKSGEDLELISPNLSHWLMSYRGLYDVMNPDGDYNCFPYAEYFGDPKRSSLPLFRYFREINKPSLVLYGSEDPYTHLPPAEAVRALLSVHPQPDLLSIQVVEGSDHSFHNTEDKEVEAVIKWLQTI